MRKQIVVVTAFLLLVAATPICAQTPDQQLVDNAFPHELTGPNDPGAHSSTYVTADLNHTGLPLLIALYTNGSRSAISVVDRAGQVVSHPSLPFLKGSGGELELIDLDNDGTPEIIAQLYSGHGLNVPDTWVFAWRSGQLVLISPTGGRHNLQLSLLSQIAPVDVDGTGKLSLLAFPGVTQDDDGNLVPKGTTKIYSLQNGQLKQASTQFTYAQWFSRRKSKPVTITRTFTGTPGATNLLVINDKTVTTAVDSARIVLNGAEVAHPSDFAPQTHVLTVPVTLVASNTLSVEVAGKPGAGIWVLVQSH